MSLRLNYVDKESLQFVCAKKITPLRGRREYSIYIKNTTRSDTAVRVALQYKLFVQVHIAM
ncbi:hypothetical protein DFP77_10879 [Marinomonas foliarum]|jgi:hypothetical protein|uniref:Uncharacterized protein n=1 Tax=Marinomonas foliarum TaxID=491950 RepID=A0A369AEV2_9GAMM|nr:hypothetical protein DFP77_10879 [Marinomonas foliarum]